MPIGNLIGLHNVAAMWPLSTYQSSDITSFYDTVASRDVLSVVNATSAEPTGGTQANKGGAAHNSVRRAPARILYIGYLHTIVLL